MSLQQVLDGDLNYDLHHGDCIEFMANMPDKCIDFSVFSPPFPALYAYNSDLADLGNSEDLESDAKLHLSFFYRQLARVVKPGRVIMVHVAQIPRMKRLGGSGMCDYRGINIRVAERAGVVYEYDWTVRKNPQSQAIRNRVRELQFVGLESDRANSRGCIPDTLIKFKVPGENKVAIDSSNEVSRDNWIKWAEACWMDIQETDTINFKAARSEDDTRHICPLQIEVIRRLTLLYSNPGELVFSPFAGVGSEGYVALGGESPKTKLKIDNPRRFFGCELKKEYYDQALKNLASVGYVVSSGTLFDCMPDDELEPE
jgi:DNA modification methylase